jgi:Replicase family/Primase C terminal 1 (PriCT-1)
MGSNSRSPSGDAAPHSADASRAVDLFPGLIPFRPYCSDYVGDGLQIRRRGAALQKRHIQLNGPATLRWMIHDIDRPDAYFAHRDAVVAEPTFIAINKANGHAHAATLLAIPVARHYAAKAAPLRYFAAVELGYARRIGADLHYAGLMVKNPLHPDWRVEWRGQRATELDELASWLDFEDMAPELSLAATTGAGRNVTLFDDLRALAYREVLRDKRDGNSFDRFHGTLVQVAATINGQFSRPLPVSEVRAIAKSVARWTWRHFSLEQFSILQTRRIRQRWANRDIAEEMQPWRAEGISRASWYRRKAAVQSAPKPTDV